MRPPSALACKGEAVEEWIDLRFFRPLGHAVARALAAGPVTADQVTGASLALGLAAGHLFFYRSPALNALGLALFLASDVLDSADGQLARLRGASTRFGRILDGVSDNLRFINLYAHLLARLVAGGAGLGALALVLLAGLSHSFQSAAVDFMRQAYLRLGVGSGSELDLPEALGRRPEPSWARRAAAALYRDYVRRQARLFPTTVALVRAVEAGDLAAVRADGTDLGTAYRARLAGPVARCAWLGQNLRFALLALTALPGRPALFFWITLGPLNLVLLALVRAQEREAALLLGSPAPAFAPAPGPRGAAPLASSADASSPGPVPAPRHVQPA